MKQYVIYFFIFAVVVAGAFGSGYMVGSSNTKVEYITQEKEVIKYVSEEKSKIYSVPNASRSELVRMLHNGEL